jgi:DNA-binding transcriptional ArsR family regulator
MDANSAVLALAALAQESRLAAFRALVQAGSDGLSAGSIGELLGIPAATLSFQLKELRTAGLVECQCEGTSRIYSPNFAAISEVMAFLTANCCEGVAASGSRDTRRGRANSRTQAGVARRRR